ncbi:MAG TPA: efflux RND transporter periplasmic adaptor subunit [Chthonomonadaceae bacterium]|nr:efflux RND transporter periplasmic adaptor subunit [Chthonomonadaceae bacterium]
MRRIIYFLIPALALGGLVIWRFLQNKHQQALQAQAASARRHAPPIVRVAPAIVRDIVHIFQGVGNVEAPFDVRVAPKVTGRLVYLQVREGAPVTRGEVLARLDASEIQAAINQQQAVVESAQASLVNAQVHYNRLYGLYKQGFTAAQDIDDARTQVNVQRSALKAARAQLRNLQAQLADTILRSPLNGFVTARFFDPGSVVAAGQPIVTVQAMRHVYVTSSVPEGVNRSIYVGMPAHADFDALPGRVFNGRVAQLNPAADPQSRQFLVRAVFDNPQNLIKPGMFGRLTIITRVTHNAVVVPHEAVQPGPKGPTVVVVDNRLTAHRRPVRTGDQDATGIAITQGVQPGEKVVILSAQPVRDGQIVRIDNGGMPVQLAGLPTVEGGGGGASPSSAGPPSGGGANAPTYGSPSSAGGLSAGGAAFSAGTGGQAAGMTGSGTGTSGGAASSGSSTSPPAITPQVYSGAPGSAGQGTQGLGQGTQGIGSGLSGANPSASPGAPGTTGTQAAPGTRTGGASGGR